MPSLTGIILGDAVRRYMKRNRKNPHSPLTKIDEAIYAMLVNPGTFAAEHSDCFGSDKDTPVFHHTFQHTEKSRRLYKPVERFVLYRDLDYIP